MRTLKWLLFLVAAALWPACSCAQNGHVVQAPFVARPGDDVVHCNCNLSFKNSACTGGDCQAHFGVDLCLPPPLNPAFTDLGGLPQDLGPALADGGVDDYSRRVDDYCRTTVTTTVYHLIKVFNGGWCQYKAPYAPNGGIGTSVECFADARGDSARATARDDGSCERLCPDVACDYATNCGAGVQDSLGGIHLDQCQCSRVVTYACPGDPPEQLPTPLFCRPPEGTVKE